MRRPRSRGLPVAQAVRMGGLAFGAAVAVSVPAQVLVAHLPAALSVLALLVIVLASIAFDAVGVAATVADEEPIHARAAKKRPGARLALSLVRHCDQVATIASDMVGDIAGTVSGAVVAILLVHGFGARAAWATPIAVAILAAATIFLKSMGKYIAVRDADPIVMAAGRVLEWVEKVLPVRFFGGNRMR